MEYQKFNDPVALLLDLCEPLNNKEKAVLGALGYRFSKEPEFRQDYINSLKRFYVKHFSEMKSGKYVRQPFDKLNKKLIDDINADTKDICFIPPYAVFNPQEKKEDISKRAEQLHKLLQKNKR